MATFVTNVKESPEDEETLAAQWRPSASIDALKWRAEALQRIRSFFCDRGVLEVDTPLLSQAGNTSPYIESFVCQYLPYPMSAQGVAFYLHTSPEFAMKRLLAAGSGPIYQIAKVFRNGEQGSRHNPEFSMLEWYRPGWHYEQLIEEVEALIHQVCGVVLSEKLTYAQAFERYLSIDVHSANVEQLINCAQCKNIEIIGLEKILDIDVWRDLLMTHCIEPNLGQEGISVIYDYPASQAALAQIRSEPGKPAIAERFEVYWKGVEIANGYQELTCFEEQGERFRLEQLARQKGQLPNVPADQNLLNALEFGLPDCAGVALGLDRLFMLSLEKNHIREIISFDFARA